ncbi:MAG: hypothetical protein WC222_01450 [Parachlamydiales bacterium]|jgi:hypothetical protein
MASHFRNNLRFALRKETSEIRELSPPNLIEKIGDTLSWFAYDFKEFFFKMLFDPRVVTVWLTAFFMILTSLLFYPVNTWHILSTVFQWINDYTNWDHVRFCLWLISEVTIFGIGIRAFGRFTNQKLLKHYNDQKLVV